MTHIQEDIQAGSIWQLGNHRLACGNASDSELVDGLYDGCEPSPIIITDVPWAAQSSSDSTRKKADRHEMKGANLTHRAQERLFTQVFGQSGASAIYAMCNWQLYTSLSDVLEKTHVVRSMIVLSKPPGFGSLWRNSHELCIYANVDPDPRQTGVPAYKNIIELPRIRKEKQHPFQKSTDVLRHLIEVDEHVRPGADIFDMFAGSCSLLLAAEQMNRRSFNIELDPKYVAVGIQRWEQLTGQKAEEIYRVY